VTYILILVPVLGRAQAIRPLVESLTVTNTPYTVLFLCSPADVDAHHQCVQTGFRTEVVEWDAGNGDWAKKINYGIGVYQGADWFLLGATDLRFHQGWDTEALAVAESTGCHVIGTNDLGNATVMAGRHSTHPFVHRDYVERGTWDEPGKLLHEGYAHQWVDTELIETAKLRGEWAFAAKSHVEHLHPFWHKGTMDATYEKALSTSYQDNQLFKRRQRLWERDRHLTPNR
jgi:hypothetical protein